MHSKEKLIAMDKGLNKSIDKIIFLDIDHVLTNTDLDNSSFRHLNPDAYQLSKINLKWLDKILDETQSKIVIASNWRKFKFPNIAWNYNGKMYFSLLEPFKRLYRNYVIGTLPPERHISKCKCLDLWFEINGWFSKTNSKYVILEDDLNEGYQNDPIFIKHLILTDYHVGLTENDANKAISFLNN